MLFLLYKNNYFILFICIVLSYVLFLTGNRSGIISFATFFIFYFIYKKFGKIYTYILFLVFLVGIISYLTYCAFATKNLLYQLNITFYQRNFLYASQRDTIIKHTIPNIVKKPFGLGFGFSSKDAMQGLGVDVTSPHNAYLKMALEGGWLFLIAYILLILQALRKAENPVTVSMLIAFNIRVFFDIATPFGYSIISALLIAPYYIEKGLKHQKHFNRLKMRSLP
ncbi:MAG: O-antigen ligase family protein [bacterium]